VPHPYHADVSRFLLVAGLTWLGSGLWLAGQGLPSRLLLTQPNGKLLAESDLRQQLRGQLSEVQPSGILFHAISGKTSFLAPEARYFAWPATLIEEHREGRTPTELTEHGQKLGAQFILYWSAKQGWTCQALEDAPQ